MKFVMYQDCVSPHQIPLACELAKCLGAENFRYVYRDKVQSGRANLGWVMDSKNSWAIHLGTQCEYATDLIENAECLLTMFRDVNLMTRRHARGLKTLVQTERWFKPRIGIARLLSTSYRRMAKEFVRLLMKGGVIYLPMGIHAARDMARLCGLLAGDLKCLFRAPKLEFERKPLGRIWHGSEFVDKRYCSDKMMMWGYFVESTKSPVQPIGMDAGKRQKVVRVLWVGRFLGWKRVDTIIKAVGECADMKRKDDLVPLVTLDLYGTGPEEHCLRNTAKRYADVIKFHPPVMIDEVRQLMRSHNVYVLASNGYEGWGAVVNEALEEGMKVIGTYEAGSSATMLSDACLFRTGDWLSLSRMFLDVAPVSVEAVWTPELAVEALLGLLRT